MGWGTRWGSLGMGALTTSAERWGIHKPGTSDSYSGVGGWGTRVLHPATHHALTTLVILSDDMQPDAPLVGSRARDVTADATDDRDAAQPALIGRRTSRVNLRARARCLGLAQRGLDQTPVLLLQLGPLHCR